ncbi:MAG: UDP-N-acetylmuramate:L-alanyl-gamma-D-glutamyl-meso-diaminopimelate ligase [Deltaproteobacteria bacterium]|nr:MAG: UDP-N-acetylmuramate:L-alanyl-gamma-D-glutamyl-meso-diaminopimelate ligase [Deltaproteobacteria bacterium]
MTDILSLDKALNQVPDKIENIHIIGICGTGMAALAGMLKQAGYKVQGSDSKVYPPMSDFLQELGIKVFDGYRPENLASKPDLVVVGNVVRQINEEAQALAASGLPYLSFPQALAHFFIKDKTSLVITGTHGKTTTCSLLASALYHARLDPSFMIGGIVREFNANFRLGGGRYFVSEGDEYDTAFFDKEAKFLHYRPDIAIISSLEFDHADIFNNLEEIKTAFAKFIQLVPSDGLIVANLDDENVAEVVSKAKCRVIGYGSSAYWRLANLSVKEGVTSFTAVKDQQDYHDFTIKIPGRHNAMNALAVIAVLDHLGYQPQLYEQGLAGFGGVKRRQEVRGTENGVTVIDDFAHHPTAVRETLRALKDSYGPRRLVAIFEPRTNSSRRAIFQKDYVYSFDAADLVMIREPVPLESVPLEEQFSSSRLAEELNARGIEAKSFASADAILEHLQKTLKNGDVAAVLSNGGFENIHDRLLEQLKD